MRGIRRSVTTADRGLEHKNDNHPSFLTDICVTVFFHHWIKCPQLITDCASVCVGVCRKLSSWVPDMEQHPHELPPANTNTCSQSHISLIYIYTHVLKTNKIRTAWKSSPFTPVVLLLSVKDLSAVCRQYRAGSCSVLLHSLMLQWAASASHHVHLSQWGENYTSSNREREREWDLLFLFAFSHKIFFLIFFRSSLYFVNTVFPNDTHNLTFQQGFTCLRWPLFLCTGVCRPSTLRLTTSAWPSAWPEPPSSSAAPTCRPWCECCRSEDSLLLLMPDLSGSRQPAACRRRRASWSHGQSSSGCRCPARERQCKGNEAYKWWIMTHLK